MSIPFRYGTTRRADKFEIGDYNTLRMCQFLLGTVQHIDADDLLLKLVMCQFLLGTVQPSGNIDDKNVMRVSIPFRYGTTLMNEQGKTFSKAAGVNSF